MQIRVVAGLFYLSSVAACATALAQDAQTFEFCARGIGAAPDNPFTKTLRVELLVSGPALQRDLLKPLASQLVQATLWRDKAGKVFVEEYDPAECAASGESEARIEVSVTQADLDELRGEISRGDGLLASVAAMARKAVTRVFSPGTGEEQRQWLRIFYATNRTPLDSTQAVGAFGSGRVDTLAYGSIEVSVRREAGMRDVESPAVFRVEKASSLADFQAAAQLTPLTKEAWAAELRRRAGRFEKPGVLLFVHGYNITFVDAARRSAQLAYDLAFPGPTVFFAWPSDAGTLKYLDDGRDAENSQIVAADFLAELAGILPGGPVYVVAHSMGNRVLMGGMARLWSEDPAKRHAFREIVLAAPDVDQETFRLFYAPKLLNTGPRFTLYASKGDLALQTSTFLQGGKRLGFGGDALFVTQGMDSVDASAVTKEFFALNHSYFGDKTNVLSDLFLLIRQGLEPAKRPHLKKLTLPAGQAWTF